MGTVGRPKKSEAAGDSKERLVQAAVELIKTKGAGEITVRNVCDAAGLSIGTFYHFFENKDDLLMDFIRERSFEEFVLETPLEHIADRICELYMHLINRYLDLGEQFMKSFYCTGNKALSAYLSEKDGGFLPGTVMARCEQEITAAIKAGILPKETDAHTVSVDVCTIVKGCVFEWALSDGAMEIEQALRRIVGRYLGNYNYKNLTKNHGHLSLFEPQWFDFR